MEPNKSQPKEVNLEGIKWKWQTDNGNWVDYLPDVAILLEQGFQAKQPQVSVDEEVIFQKLDDLFLREKNFSVT